MRRGRLPSGLIAHRGKGRRVYYFIDFTHDGDRYYQRLGSIPRPAAEKKLAEVREFATNRSLGLAPPDTSATMMTLREVADLYLATYKTQMEAQGAALRGWEITKQNINRCLAGRGWLAKKPVALVTIPDMERLRNDLVAMPTIGERTTRSSLTDIRTVLSYASRTGLLRRNPLIKEIFDGIPSAPPREVWELPLSSDDALLDALGNDWIARTGLLLGLDAGLRNISVQHIRLGDLALGDEVFLVTILKGKRRKVKAAEWTPVQTRRLLEALRDAHARRTAEGATGSDFLLPPRSPGQHRACPVPKCSGLHASPDYFLRKLQASAATAGLCLPRRPIFHDLRHIWNTRTALILRPEVRRAISSHEDESASKIYVHLNTRSGARSILDEAKRLDDLLRSKCVDAPER